MRLLPTIVLNWFGQVSLFEGISTTRILKKKQPKDGKLKKIGQMLFKLGQKTIKIEFCDRSIFEKNPEFWLAFFYANLQIRVCNRCGWNRIRNMSAFEYSTTGMILESVEYKQFKLRLKSDSNRRKYLNWVNQDQLTWPFRLFYLKPY